MIQEFPSWVNYPFKVTFESLLACFTKAQIKSFISFVAAFCCVCYSKGLVSHIQNNNRSSLLICSFLKHFDPIDRSRANINMYTKTTLDLLSTEVRDQDSRISSAVNGGDFRCGALIELLGSHPCLCSRCVSDNQPQLQLRLTSSTTKRELISILCEESGNCSFFPPKPHPWARQPQERH